MTISENLVRHLYVAASNVTAEDFKAVDMSEKAEGSIALALTDDNSALYFQHVGKGGVTRSDLIPVDNVMYVNATAAADMLKSLKNATIALTTDALNAGKVVAGTYIVRITISNYVGMSDEDTYYKYGQVVSNGNLTAADFYKKLKASLEANLSRETTKMFEIFGGTSNVVITEVELPWRLGTMLRVPVNFKVDLVANDGDFEPTVEKNVTTYDWGTVTTGVDTNKLTNSKDIADLEYFCMGERADIYRGKGWPNVIPTEYMVNAKATNGYAVLDIHYAYQGTCEDIQKSEKTITIVAEDKSMLSDIADALEENVTGLTVKKSANWE